MTKPAIRRNATLAALLISCALQMNAQQPVPTAPIERVAPPDAQVEAASVLIGRAVFLRCLCAEDNLSFDVAGRPAGTVKPTDWTLAAVNIAKVERKSAAAVVLEGVRVAIVYNPANHEFLRRPQKDETVRIQLADAGDPRLFSRTLDSVFSVGIDLRLQQAMPPYWRHYFDPKMQWGQDALAGQLVFTPGSKVGPQATQPVVTHRGSLSYTMMASRDKIKGLVQLRLVLDAQGVPQRVSIVQPLGYGLDARAVQAAEKYRFTPAMLDGKPVNATVLINQEFTLVEQAVSPD